MRGLSVLTAPGDSVRRLVTGRALRTCLTDKEVHRGQGVKELHGRLLGGDFAIFGGPRVAGGAGRGNGSAFAATQDTA